MRKIISEGLPECAKSPHRFHLNPSHSSLANLINLHKDNSKRDKNLNDGRSYAIAKGRDANINSFSEGNEPRRVFLGVR
jgi:hypothetical protein